jgi:DNA-binding transcriptional regulator YiaG
MGKMKNAKRDYKGFMDLNYVRIKNVPIEVEKEFSGLVSASIMREVERKVARALLIYRVPIRGREVEYFRSVLGMAQRQFAQLFDVSQVAVLKWEREKSKRLSLSNEIAFRAIMAKQFNLRLRADGLIGGMERPPKQLVVDFEREERVLDEQAA